MTCSRGNIIELTLLIKKIIHMCGTPQVRKQYCTMVRINNNYDKNAKSNSFSSLVDLMAATMCYVQLCCSMGLKNNLLPDLNNSLGVH